jgi:hypothetical protein
MYDPTRTVNSRMSVMANTAVARLSRPGAGVLKRKQLCWVCNVRLKREEGAGSSRTKMQGIALS